MRSIRATLEHRAPLLPTAATAMLVGALGCSKGVAPPMPAGPEDDLPRRGGTLRLATFGDLRNGLDPVVSPDGVSLAPIHLLFAGLLDYDAQGHVVPDLAERWEIADGGLTYRFFLRQGVRMHDGTDLLADDVKRSVERALHPSTPDANASSFEGLAGYAAYVAGKADHLAGVTVEDRHVVSFHLEKPDATFPHLLTLHTLRPTCKSAGDRYVDTWLPCGAGPFKLLPGDWRRGVSLRLVRHDAYFEQGLPYLDAVEWTYNMKPLAQRLRFESGELDVVRDLTYADSSRFMADPRWSNLGVFENDSRIQGEAMNTRIPPFDNVEIRRAVSAAIDRTQYLLLQPATMSPLDQALPGVVADVAAPLPHQHYDYRAALDHMRKAGYPYDPATGVGGWPDPIEYLVYDGGLPTLTSQILQQDLAKIGLRLRITIVSWTAFLAVQAREGGVAMSQGNWTIDYPDPSNIFDKLFATSAISPSGSLNPSFYSNPTLDALLARAHAELDPEARKVLYRDADAIVCDDAPWAFTFGYHAFDLRQPYVRGFVPHVMWPMDVTHVWLDRPGSEPAGADVRAKP
jgi:ABC-type transport system substrate-binding protein